VSRKFEKKTYRIKGMSCSGCETIIENKLSGSVGIITVKASYKDALLEVSFDENIINEIGIIKIIDDIGYNVTADSKNKNALVITATLIIILAVYLIIKNTIGFDYLPKIEQNMGYGILFIIGLITSLHCIAMCGAINLSQCISYNHPAVKGHSFKHILPGILYNSGRVLSYTIIGGIAGAIGSVISLTGLFKGTISILAGVFMLVMGLKLLDIIPWLRKFNFRLPTFQRTKRNTSLKKAGPFYAGLLNGFMPCGPLQAMQIYALGTGSFLTGAISMLSFGLGTVPLMFTFSLIATFLNNRLTHKMMKISAVLIIGLGLIMINRGVNVTGLNTTVQGIAQQFVAAATPAPLGEIQTIASTFKARSYAPITVKKGIPVKWIINIAAGEINGCNSPVTIRAYNIVKKLVPGENIIEFTPIKEGTITYTCWMGMISSTIKVVAE